MAADFSKFPAWFITFVLLTLQLLASFSSAEGKNGSQPCVDGTYEHDGKTCCLCGAGLYLEEHCTTNLQYGKCKTCDPDTYSSHPNNHKSCEPCTSCSQPNANLEVDKPCTRARDTKCRCKKDHYCSSGTETCIICYPCKECGAEGIKAACTAKNNTVCNDITEGGNKTGMIVGIIVGVIVFIGVALLAFFWKKRRDRKKKQTQVQLRNGSAADVEMQEKLLRVVDLQPYLPDIAEAIGWSTMHDVAMRTSTPNSAIESCQRDYQGSQEQTLQLLIIWVERQGRGASDKLIHILQNAGKKGTADTVRDILSRPNLSA